MANAGIRRNWKKNSGDEVLNEDRKRHTGRKMAICRYFQLFSVMLNEFIKDFPSFLTKSISNSSKIFHLLVSSKCNGVSQYPNGEKMGKPARGVYEAQV